VFFLILMLAAVLFWGNRRILRYMQFFQQEEYDGARFLAWLARNRAFDTRASLVCAIVLLVDILCKGAVSPWEYLLAGLALVCMGFLEEDPTRHGKILLKITDRVRRIHYVFLALFLVQVILLGMDAHACGRGCSWAVWCLLFLVVQAMPLILVLSNMFLMPFEKRLQGSYVAEAAEVVRRVHPLVVGITGSYGKTSTKTILNDMLSAAEPTFTLGRSINTLMGITREIRTRMKYGQRYAVIEMGAYQRGSIKNVCALIRPQAAIVTAVGIMHLERFGSQENIFLAKSELAQAVPANGILVMNGDDALVRRMAKENPKAQVYFYGFDRSAPLDCWMDKIVPTPTGSEFSIFWKGVEYRGRTSLSGKHMLSNIMAAFSMACVLGQDPRHMLAVVASLEGVENRLQVKRTGGLTELRDAFNSNPVGFASALDELSRAKASRRILITPGMVELGTQQAVANGAMGQKAASVCDEVIVVGKTNRESLVAGLLKGGFKNEHIHLYDNRTAAFDFLRKMQQDGDAILIENDLPDLYEAKTAANF